MVFAQFTPTIRLFVSQKIKNHVKYDKPDRAINFAMIS